MPLTPQTQKRPVNMTDKWHFPRCGVEQEKAMGLKTGEMGIGQACADPSVPFQIPSMLCGYVSMETQSTFLFPFVSVSVIFLPCFT